MKFLVQNYSCLQNPWLGGYHLQIPVLSVLCPQLNLLNPPWTKFLGTPLLLGHVTVLQHWPGSTLSQSGFHLSNLVCGWSQMEEVKFVCAYDMPACEIWHSCLKWCVNKYHETESQMGIPLLKLGTVWKWVVNFMLQLLDIRGKGFQ